MQLEAFSVGWELIKSRFSNNCNKEIMGIYYKFLRNKLNDAEWAIAVERVVLEESFFPSAKTLIEKVKPSDQSLAATAWETIIAAAKNGQRPELDPNAECALLRIGGRMAIETAPENKLPFLKKDFTHEYALVVAQQTREALPCNSLDSANSPKTTNLLKSQVGNASAVKTRD